MVVAANLADLLEFRAARTPESLVFSLFNGDEVTDRLTFRDLHFRAVAIAARLRRDSIAGQRVMLLYAQELEFVSALFACWYAGGIPVPLQTPHPNRTIHQLRAISQDCGAALLLTSTTALNRLSLDAIKTACDRLDCIVTDQVTGIGTAFDPHRSRVNDIALIQYTSGSTGSPKGVVVRHDNLMHNLTAIQKTFGTSPGTTAVLWLPFFHDMGLIGGLLQTIFCGSHLVTVPAAYFSHSPAVWLRAITRFQANISGGPDSAYALCVDRIQPHEKSALDLRSWRVAFNGSEPVRASTLDRFAAAFAECGFRKDAFRTCYGLAEATLLVSTGSPVTTCPSNGKLERTTDFVGAGLVIEDEEVRIVDPVRNIEVNSGCIGEIWLKGPSVAAGYWERESETASNFGASIGAEGPFLRTGDLGFIREGQLTVAGRLKNILIVSGRNLEQEDIEKTVRDCDDRLSSGGGATFLSDDDGAALVVVHEIQQISGDDDYRPILSRIRRELGIRYDVTIRAIVLVRRRSLPRTSSGKIKRYACHELYRQSRLSVLAHSGYRTAGQPRNLSKLGP